MKLFLIDGNSYVYRAFYAIRDLSNSRGLPTNAIFGFTNMLLKVIREKKPDGIAISFDSPVPTERHRLFGDYKAHRPETPGDLVRQLPHIRRVIDALRIRVFEMPGYEADDLLATIAKEAARRGAEVYIITSDKDMLQVVGDGVKVYDPVKDRVLDAAYVEEKFGVGPERVPEYMALAGDAVDNIPGIKGIGEKTARELLSAAGSLEELFSHPEKIKKEKIRQLVLANREIAELSRTLATIDTAVPVEVEISEFAAREPDWPALLSLFTEFEFTSLMKLVPSTSRETAHEAVMTSGRLREMLGTVKAEFSFDIEATGKDPRTDRIVGFALCTEHGRSCYVPLGHSYPGAPSQIPAEEAFSAVSHLLADPAAGKIGHNLKYDVSMLDAAGVRTEGPLLDTMIASYLLNPNRPNHNLEDVAFELLSYRKRSFKEVLGKRTSFTEVPVEEAAAYSAEDAALAFELKAILFPLLEQEGLLDLYREIEMPLIPVLAAMEQAGCKVDAKLLLDLSKELDREIDSIQRRIYFLAGEEFNINSPKQLGRVLFETLGLKPGRRTKTGYSTEMGVLEELAASHELPREVLDYRSLSKLKSTYTDVLPGLVNPKTGRIHTSFNQTATATGRLSSSDPNLQNIPVRGEWGRRIREAFIAEKGHLLLSADYSQIELRVLAHLSRDEGLISAFRAGVDVHARTAAELFNVGPDSVTPELRRIAKTVNFGIVYGISAFGLSGTLNIPPEDAKKYINGYFASHPGVQSYIERSVREAKELGYVKTLFGRKRAVPELKSTNAATRSLGERLAMNSPVQGTAADIIKIAMIRLWRALREKNLKTRLILQVHDELVLEAPEDEVQAVSGLVRHEMESAAALSVPLEVDISIGRNWACDTA